MAFELGQTVYLKGYEAPFVVVELVPNMAVTRVMLASQQGDPEAERLTAYNIDLQASPWPGPYQYPLPAADVEQQAAAGDEADDYARSEVMPREPTDT